MSGAAVAVLTGLTGCSFSFRVGGPGLTVEELERNLSAEVEERLGRPLEEADCSRGLEDEPGDRSTCVVLSDGVRATWDVRVTRVADESIFFEWQVEDGSQRLLDGALPEEIGARFSEVTGLVLEKVVCPDGSIGGTPGSVVTCQATTTTGKTGPIEVRFDAAEGMNVDLTWRLPEG